MTKSSFLRPLALAFTLGTLCTAVIAAENDEKGEAPPAIGSVRVAGKVAKADRPALAKISFSDALKVAEATIPGKVIHGALEVEDGNLQYAFEVVKADKVIDEVMVDAGNGKVLGIDHDDND
jgi:uncharacterized membrane protein YkoI